jgi:hypothetical protein
MKPFPAMPVQIYFPAADLITLIHKNTNICVLHLHNNQSGLDAVPSKILKSEPECRRGPLGVPSCSEKPENPAPADICGALAAAVADYPDYLADFSTWGRRK